jgi:hypothetical protein
MIHAGLYYFGRKRVACRNDYCTVCREPTLAEGRRSLVVLHVFFVPLLPLGVRTRWFCIVCGRQTNAKRPSHRGILIAGIVFGAFMAFSGVITWLETREPLMGWPMIGLGGAMVGGLTWMICTQNYQAYQQWKKDIPPLSSDACPYCHRPLAHVGRSVRCEACDVRIVTARG